MTFRNEVMEFIQAYSAMREVGFRQRDLDLEEQEIQSNDEYRRAMLDLQQQRLDAEGAAAAGRASSARGRIGSGSGGTGGTGDRPESDTRIGRTMDEATAANRERRLDPYELYEGLTQGGLPTTGDTYTLQGLDNIGLFGDDEEGEYAIPDQPAGLSPSGYTPRFQQGGLVRPITMQPRTYVPYTREDPPRSPVAPEMDTLPPRPAGDTAPARPAAPAALPSPLVDPMPYPGDPDPERRTGYASPRVDVTDTRDPAVRRMPRPALGGAEAEAPADVDLDEVPVTTRAPGQSPRPTARPDSITNASTIVFQAAGEGVGRTIRVINGDILAQREQAVGGETVTDIDFENMEGGLSFEEYDAMSAAVDPNNQMLPHYRHMAILAEIYTSGEAAGMPMEDLDRLASATLMAQYTQARTLGTLALNALEDGDVWAATDLLNSALERHPTHHQIIVTPDEQRGIMYRIVNADGEEVESGYLNSEQAWQGAQGIANGSLFVQSVGEMVQEAETDPMPRTEQSAIEVGGAALANVMGLRDQINEVRQFGGEVTPEMQAAFDEALGNYRAVERRAINDLGISRDDWRDMVESEAELMPGSLGTSGGGEGGGGGGRAAGEAIRGSGFMRGLGDGFTSIFGAQSELYGNGEGDTPASPAGPGNAELRQGEAASWPQAQINEVLNQARDAIAAGASREAIVERLVWLGIDPEAL